jgi:hypothetical protein
MGLNISLNKPNTPLVFDVLVYVWNSFTNQKNNNDKIYLDLL